MILVGYEYYFIDSGVLMSGTIMERHTLELSNGPDLMMFDIKKTDSSEIVLNVCESSIFETIEKSRDYCKQESDRWARYEERLEDEMQAEEILESDRIEAEQEFQAACHEEGLAQLEREER